MQAIEGRLIFAQESRFQLCDQGGVSHHFVVSPSCAADPEQLSALQRNQTAIRVGYRESSDTLAHVALRIDLLDA